MHGGLFSKDGVKIEDIKAIDRNRQPPESGNSFLKRLEIDALISLVFQLPYCETILLLHIGRISHDYCFISTRLLCHISR